MCRGCGTGNAGRSGRRSSRCWFKCFMRTTEALYSDYVQAGYHGWQVPMKVNEAIRAGEMFIDTADELISLPDYAGRHGVLVRRC